MNEMCVKNSTYMFVGRTASDRVSIVVQGHNKRCSGVGTAFPHLFALVTQLEDRTYERGSSRYFVPEPETEVTFECLLLTNWE